MKGDVSSQFLSGLLMALPYAGETTTVEVQGALVSQPYVAMTLAVMEAFGVTVANRKFRRFDVRPAHTGPRLRDRARRLGRQLLLRAAAITGGTVTVEGLGTDERPGRHGVRGRARAHGLQGRARSPTPDDRHRRAAPRAWTST